MDFSSVGNSSIVKCYGCNSWVRIFATECVSASAGGESFSPQRWCFGCLADVDELTVEAMKQFSDYPDGLPSWDKEDNEDEPEKDETPGEEL